MVTPQVVGHNDPAGFAGLRDERGSVNPQVDRPRCGFVVLSGVCRLLTRGRFSNPDRSGHPLPVTRLSGT